MGNDVEKESREAMMLDSAAMYDRWKDVRQFAIFGFGHVCKRSIEEAKKFAAVSAIYDNDATLAGQVFHGVPIKPFDGAKREEKVLIAAHYEAIKRQLEGCGLKEYEDFYALDKYLSVMHWHRHGKIYASELHMSITTKCTLQCKKCNMFMANYEAPAHLDGDVIREDFASLFSAVDYVETLALLGGEPFLYPDLGALITYLHDTYHEKYGVMELITNGTILPDAALRKILKEKKIFLRISDYSAAIPYAERLAALKATLDAEGIPYYSNQSLTWLDFGFPDKPLHLPDDKVYQHMIECSPAFKGINDKKIYFCHVVWSANRCGLYAEKETDAYPLEKGRSAELVDYLIGVMKAPVGLCQYCAGCSDKNKSVIPIAEQKR